MRNSKVIEYLREKHSLSIGIAFDPISQTSLELEIDDIKFEIHMGSDFHTSIITFISIRFKTDDKSELIRALNALRKYFDIDGIPDINVRTEFYNASVLLLGVDTHSGEDLKLILRDRVSSMLKRYEIELKLEKYQ